MVYLLRYVPNMGATLKLAILNLSQFFKMESGSCDISNNIGIFCRAYYCKQIRCRSYGSKVTILLLQVTEDEFDHIGENCACACACACVRVCVCVCVRV